MEENVFKAALAAISSGEYSENDVKTVKERLSVLNKEEASIKRKMERDKNSFVKEKGKSNSKIKSIRKEIKELKNFLNSVQ